MKTGSILDSARFIDLSHGSGGKAMKDLIDDVFLSAFGSAEVHLEDQARIALDGLAERGNRLAFTTDSYVVDPLFFPGGDIGSLAVNGTVNDLCVGGATPLYLSCSMIIEEGFAFADLRRIVESMKHACATAGVRIVTGDTKVVGRGAVDKLYINTAGVGIIQSTVDISAGNARVGDSVIISGTAGDHGAAIMCARADLVLESDVQSDCQSLHGLIHNLLSVCPKVRCLRDATRGGVATVLNEFASASGVGITIDEQSIIVTPQVQSICDILGLDPLYLANEGKVVAVVPSELDEVALSVMRSHPAGKSAAIIGKIVQEHPGVVVAKTIFGAERVIDMLVGDQLPRIC